MMVYTLSNNMSHVWCFVKTTSELGKGCKQWEKNAMW